MPTDAPISLWPPAFEAAIFDFDGTISDTAALWRRVDEDFLGARGFAVPDDYALTLSTLGFSKGAEYTIERFGLHESVESICKQWIRMGRELYEAEATLRPGVVDYIGRLRARGVRVALATTNDPEVLDGLSQVDVANLFDARVHGREVARGKDYPDIYLEAARRLEVEPASCIVFEDIPAALASARAAGMLACGVRSSDPVQDMAQIEREAAARRNHLSPSYRIRSARHSSPLGITARLLYSEAALLIESTSQYSLRKPSCMSAALLVRVTSTMFAVGYTRASASISFRTMTSSALPSHTMMGWTSRTSPTVSSSIVDALRHEIPQRTHVCIARSRPLDVVGGKDL